MVRHAILPIVIFLLITISLSAESVIAWEADPATYRLVVRRDNLIVVDLETTKTEVKLNIAPGIYEYQISIIDPFGNEVSSSSWKKLEIREQLPPFFRVEVPGIGFVGDPLIILKIHGNKLTPNTAYSLVQNNGDGTEIPVDGSLTDDTVTFRLNAKEMEIGDWDLLAKTPTGKTFIASNALRILSLEEKVLTTVKQESWKISENGRVAIEVDAEYNDKMKVHVMGENNETPEAEIVKSENGYILVNIDMEDSQPGKYQIILENINNGKTMKEEYIIVPSNKERPETWFRFRSGLSPLFFINTSESTVAPTFLGGLESVLNVKSGWQKKFWKDIGMEVHGLIGVGPAGAVLSDDIINITGMVDLAAVWSPGKLENPPSVVLGIGSMWMNITSNTAKENHLYLRTTIGWDFGGRAKRFFHLAATGMMIISASGSMPIIGLSIGSGLIF